MGSFTTAQLRTLGIGEKKTRTLLEQGKLFRLVRGLYIDDYSPASVARTITGHYKNIALSGKSAAQIHLRLPLTLPIQAEGTGSVQAKAFSIRHSRLPACTSINGIPVVEALWAARASKDFARLILEKHYFGRDGERRLNHDLSRMQKVPAWLRETIATTPIGACSELERKLVRPLIKRGYRVRMNQYIGPYCFDILLDQWKIAIEVDSEKYHANAESFISDRWKANSGTLHGWIVLRFTDSCINWNLDSVLDEIEQAIRWVQKRRPRADYKPGWPACQKVWEWNPTVGYANKQG
ncbi:DUF559 domain-containing protein [uncultured Corynebacterium sp.]|uniref:DUF559 domain-containing protein n=1 Tax=uncultured Corynebacterium sp. TaxID=159447 RepID=UPI00262B6D06|nr:DUF559 domain-containing protein [uncultured Corynebacterium sp.]